MNLQKLIHRLLEPAQGHDPASRAVDVAVIVMIALNTLVLMLETVPGLLVEGRLELYLAFKFFSVVFFGLEYSLRVWTCVCDPRYAHPVWGRSRYMLSPMGLLDLLALLPFVALFVVPYEVYMGELFALSSLRLLRLGQVVRLARYFSAFQTLWRVLEARREELTASLFVMCVLLVVASSGMYFAEHKAQPEVFSSIPASMWWAVSTLTTVGYGDMVPRTGVGRLLGGVIALLGMGLFALPAGILASGFAQELQRRSSGRCCPRCGEALEPRLRVLGRRRSAELPRVEPARAEAEREVG